MEVIKETTGAGEGKKPLTKLKNVFELIKEAFVIFKERWGKLLLISLVPLIVGIVILVILSLILAFEFGLNSALLANFPKQEGLAFLMLLFQKAGMALIILATVLFLFLLILQMVSGIAFLAEICSGEKIGVKQAYKIGFKKFFPYWWVSVLSGFIIFSGLILLIVPVFIFGIWFSFAFYILLTEGIGGLKALLKSREYIRGYFWPILGRMLVIGFLYGLLITTGVRGINSFFAMLRFPLAGEVISAAIYLLLPIFFPITYFAIYKNLRLVKGDFEFKPAIGSKVIFSVFGILGFLAVPLGIYLIFRVIVLTGGLKLPQGGQDIPNIPGIIERVITPMPASEI